MRNSKKFIFHEFHNNIPSNYVPDMNNPFMYQKAILAESKAQSDLGKEVRQVIEVIGKSRHFSETEIGQIQHATVELILNAYRHTSKYAKETEKPTNNILLNLFMSNGYANVFVSNTGKFNLKKAVATVKTMEKQMEELAKLKLEPTKIPLEVLAKYTQSTGRGIYEMRKLGNQFGTINQEGIVMSSYTKIAQQYLDKAA